MKLSVIIPVGNKDAWANAERSIRASIAACKETVEWELLPCFDLEHRGAFTARNEGLRRATGDYVAWVDCDDVLKENWADRIASAVSERSHDGRPIDVLVFAAVELKDGRERLLRFNYPSWMDGDSYGKKMLYGVDAPHWLWNRVFRRELLSGVNLTVPVDEDYQFDLLVLPRVKTVRYLDEALYTYVKHGHGLSSYVRTMDYGAAGREFLDIIEGLPSDWREGSRMGLGLLMPDVVLHDRRAKGAGQWVRKYALQALFRRDVGLRFKIKILLAALMFWK